MPQSARRGTALRRARFLARTRTGSRLVIGALLGALVLGLSTAPPSAAAPAAGPGTTPGEHPGTDYTVPTSEADDAAWTPLARADGAGRLRLLAARPGGVLSTAPAGARGLAEVARRQVRRFAGAFGLRDTHGLRTLRTARMPAGHDTVRFQQTVDGRPVVGGELVSVLDRDGSLLAISGEVSPTGSVPAFTVAASRAAGAARAAVARRAGVPPAKLRSTRPTQAVFDASLLRPDGRGTARPVWQLTVSGRDRLDVRALVLVDARTARVLAAVDRVAALDRVVCDAARRAGAGQACRPGHYRRTEGQPPTGLTDVDQAYDLTGATATFFAQRFGVDLTALIGADFGDGPKLRSTTRYCGPDGCPFDNAFWNGRQMVYGPGFTSADDVVAHELTHGVIQQTGGLLYWFQSGALNESIADVFGELVDLTDGLGDDAPQRRWRLGEDLPPTAGGAARDMADPTLFGQPDSTVSEYYDFAPDYDDNGAVHTNSGVPNKTAYLIADGTGAEPGGHFRGHTVAGIGLDRTAVLYWTALQMLTPGSDFADLAAVLQQGCAQLAATATAGMSTTDCDSVAGATAATGLTWWEGPSAPRNVSMSAGVRSVLVRWEGPAGAGASPVTSYAVWARPAHSGEDFVALEPGARDYVVTGLRSGVDYTVGLVAVTADGTSLPVTRRFRGSGVRVRWPQAVRMGERLRVRGVLTSDGTTPLAGRRVRLWRKVAGVAGFDRVAAARTGPAGRFRLSVAARERATYVVTSDPGSRRLGARSARHVVPVRPR